MEHTTFIKKIAGQYLYVVWVVKFHLVSQPTTLYQELYQEQWNTLYQDLDFALNPMRAFLSPHPSLQTQ